MNGAAVHPGLVSKTDDEPPKGGRGWGRMRELHKDHNLPKKPPSALAVALAPFKRIAAKVLAFVNTLAVQFLLYCFYVFLFQALIAAVRVKEEVYLTKYLLDNGHLFFDCQMPIILPPSPVTIGGSRAEG